MGKMPSGPHGQLVLPAALAWAAVADCVKALDNPALLKAARPTATLVFRPYVADQTPYWTNPQGWLDIIVQRLQGFRAPGRLYVEGPNEPGRGDILKVIVFYQSFVPLAHAAGLLVVGPNCATGDYEHEDWLAYRADGWMGMHAIGVHGYWSSQYGPTQWNGLRWRSYYDPALDRSLPIFLTECGFDVVRDGPRGTYIGTKGWQLDPNLDAAKVVTSYGAYARQLLPHEHAFFFTAAPNSTWTAYGTDALVPSLIKELGQGGQPMPNVGQGFTKCIPLIGQFVQDQVYHFPNSPQEIGLAVAEFGHATWVKATNETWAHCNDGRSWRDFGNFSKTGGAMVIVSGPFH